MFKVLYADTRKLFFQRGLRECLAAVLLYLLGYVALIKLVLFFVGGELYADDVYTAYAGLAVFLISGCTLVSTVSDYDDGCIRNKLICGAGRPAVFLSALITGGAQAVLLSMAAFIESLILAGIFTKGGLMTMTVEELADYWLINTMACIAIAVFSTMLIMILGGKKISYIVGIALAVGFNIFNMEVNDKLYPTQGSCTLSGFKLTLYNFYDRFVPYSYLSMRPHHSTLTYMIGAAVMIVVSVIVGMIIFNNKEIQ
ncbi:MAG: hypothetical protein J6X66_08655 [Lachnospiraceae bacterium]|nr:hypothetical protein [Lachnospiraceae bacterium]